VIGRIVTWPARTALDLTGRTALVVLDVVLASPYTDEALRRVVASQAAERAVGYALEQTDEVIASEALEQAISRALASPETERLVESVVDSPAMERLVARAVDSRLIDAVIDQLLESEDMWRLVEEIARSPAVTEAISHQSMGFADQVAGELRSRSVRADAAVERAARRLLRRRPAPAHPRLLERAEDPEP